MAAKYDSNVEAAVIAFIQEKVPGTTISPGSSGVHEALKSGVVLCNLANALKPGCVAKVNDSKMAFKQMENINNFLDACHNAFGMNSKCCCAHLSPCTRTIGAISVFRRFSCIDGLCPLARLVPCTRFPCRCQHVSDCGSV